MKIEMIRGTVCEGKSVKRGQVVSCSPEEGRLLIRMGKALPYEAKGPSEDPPEIRTQNRSQGLKKSTTKKTVKRGD